MESSGLSFGLATSFGNEKKNKKIIRNCVKGIQNASQSMVTRYLYMSNAIPLPSGDNFDVSLGGSQTFPKLLECSLDFPEFPRTSPEVPRRLAGSSLTVDFRALQRFPKSFLGSLTPSDDSKARTYHCGRNYYGITFWKVPLNVHF